MSLWRDELKTSNATNATLVVLAAIAISSLGRVVQAPGLYVTAVPAVVVGAAFAIVFGRRSLGLGFLLLVAVGAITLPALFVHKIAPTPAALSALRALIRSGLSDAGSATPPVAAASKYTVLVWCALLLLGFLGAAWIVVRRPLGTVVSALGVVTFAGSIGDGRGRTAYALAAIVATIAFFLAEGRQRIARWAGGTLPIPAWFGVPTLVIASAAALAAPAIFGDQPIVQLRGALRPRIVIIKPLSDIRRQLKIDPPIEVMRVSSSRPLYWRLTALDTYDGKEWLLQAHPHDLTNSTVPQTNPRPTGEIVDQTYTLTSLLSPWLPAAYSARAIHTTVPVQFDAPSQTLLLKEDSTPGLTYTVRSELPKVTADEPAKPKAASSDAEKLFGSYARPIVAGTTTPLDEARRLVSYFRRFTYSENVPAGHSIARLQQFLRERKGYCEQFAAAMTLMMRGLGADARVGVGFLPGSIVNGSYVVSTKDAHAWVEVNLPGGGWTTFDPTPGHGVSSSVPKTVQALATPRPIPQQTAVPVPTPEQQNLPSHPVPVRKPFHIPSSIIYALVAMAVLSITPTAKRVRRSRRRRGSPDVIVVGAFSEFLDRARDLGWVSSASETHREFARRVGAGNGVVYTELANVTGRVLYADTAVSQQDAAKAWATLERSLHELRGNAPWWRRALAELDPRTLVPPGITGRLLKRVKRYTPTGRPSSS
jgi:transglutaminase-like putative cysteine protease